MAKPNKEPAPKAPKVRRVHLPFKEKEYFTENLALLLKAAVPVGQALASLEEAARSKGMKQAIRQMGADIEAGAPLANALERSGIVGSQTLALVRLGEQSGRLIENLQLSAQQEEKRHTFQAKIRSALLYPGFVVGLTTIVGLGVAWFLLPRLAVTFSQLHVKLPLVSRIMIGLGVFLKHHGKIVVPSVLFGVLLIGYVLFAAPSTKRLGQRLLFMVPGISQLMREVEIAQFGYLLGTLLEAGLPITKAIGLLADSSTTLRYKEFYRYLAGSLEDGHTIQQSFKSYKNIAKLLPPAVQQMVIAGEHSGSLSEVLLTVGRTYGQKSDITAGNLQTILEPILLVCIAGGVLLVAVAVLLPIYSLLGGLNQ